MLLVHAEERHVSLRYFDAREAHEGFLTVLHNLSFPSHNLFTGGSSSGAVRDYAGLSWLLILSYHTMLHSADCGGGKQRASWVSKLRR